METTILLLAQAEVAQPAPSGGSLFTSLIPMVLIMAIFYWILIVPQKRQLKEHQAMVSALRGPFHEAYAFTLLRWGGFAGIDPTQFPALWGHVQKVAALPPVARAIERERLQLNVYKAA